MKWDANSTSDSKISTMIVRHISKKAGWIPNQLLRYNLNKLKKKQTDKRSITQHDKHISYAAVIYKGTKQTQYWQTSNTTLILLARAAAKSRLSSFLIWLILLNLYVMNHKKPRVQRSETVPELCFEPTMLPGIFQTAPGTRDILKDRNWLYVLYKSFQCVWNAFIRQVTNR